MPLSCNALASLRTSADIKASIDEIGATDRVLILFGPGYIGATALVESADTETVVDEILEGDGRFEAAVVIQSDLWRRAGAPIDS